MPTYQPPQNDTERLNLLRTAAQTAAVDYANGIEYISQDIFNELHDFLPQFDEAFLDVAATFGRHDREVQERDEALERLQLFVTDLCEVVRRRVHREEEPVGVFRFYYLDEEGQLPAVDGPAEWLELAANVVAGDAEAVAAGYPAAVCPSAAELAAVLATARREAADVQPAGAAADRAQAAIDALRAQADALIAEVVSELRFHLRKEPASSQRRVMRTYGVRFGYRPGEPQDMDDVYDAD